MLNTDLIVGFKGLALASLVFLFTREIGPLGRIFVDYSLIALFFFSALITVKGFIKPERGNFFETSEERNNIFVGIIILLMYIFFIPKAGFLSASYIFYFLLTLYLSEKKLSVKNLLQAAITSIVIVTGFYFIFRNVLQVPLPGGSWFQG